MDYLTIIPYDCIYNILDACILKSLINFFKVNRFLYYNKEIRLLLKKKYTEDLNIKFKVKKDFLNTYFGRKYAAHNWIHNLFGDKLYSAKILEWKSHFLGFTGYIDNISHCDITSDIMVGIDIFKRPFFVLRENSGSVVTFFKRFSCTTNLIWATACHCGVSKINTKILSTWGHNDYKLKNLLYRHARIFKIKNDKNNLHDLNNLDTNDYINFTDDTDDTNNTDYTDESDYTDETHDTDDTNN